MTEACRAEKVRAAAGSFPRQGGFSLMELGIVLVIAGIIISLGAVSWGVVVEARKNAVSRGELRRARECIVNAVISSGQYPSYSFDYNDNTRDVDRCLRPRTDAWGAPFYFIEGIRDTTQGGGSLAGGCMQTVDTAATNDPCSPSHTTKPPIKPDTTSTATDKDGNVITDVAFILVSFGKSRVADNVSTIGGLFPAGTLAAQMLTGTATGQPDFSLNDVGRDNDDIYLIVTYPELLAELSKARM